MRRGWTSTAAKNGAILSRMKEISRHKSTDVLAGVEQVTLFTRSIRVDTRLELSRSAF